ncbi:MAG: hypothetical protein CMN74_07125 [Sphingorhabdus sp.]|nr:hypothetical protein [Sphingorhabdus sp.]
MLHTEYSAGQIGTETFCAVDDDKCSRLAFTQELCSVAIGPKGQQAPIFRIVSVIACQPYVWRIGIYRSHRINQTIACKAIFMSSLKGSDASVSCLHMGRSDLAKSPVKFIPAMRVKHLSKPAIMFFSDPIDCLLIPTTRTFRHHAAFLPVILV